MVKLIYAFITIVYEYFYIRGALFPHLIQMRKRSPSHVDIQKCGLYIVNDLQTPLKKSRYEYMILNDALCFEKNEKPIFFFFSKTTIFFEIWPFNHLDTP